MVQVREEVTEGVAAPLVNVKQASRASDRGTDGRTGSQGEGRQALEEQKKRGAET